MGRCGDVREKVRKLLNQAADREGTPEGDVFRDKAFALIAQYGLDPAKLGDPTDAGAEMKVVDLDMSGAYQRQQIGLLNALARALHCEVVYTAAGTGRTIMAPATSNACNCCTVLRPQCSPGRRTRSSHRR